MSIPETARQYILPKPGAFQNLTIGEKKVEEPKDNEVLVKVHAVSLQYRDIVTVTGDYYGKVLPDLVPGSDMAGEVIAIGKNVKTWNVGDRVCSNFSTENIYGDPTPFTLDNALGGPSHGVLTEYRTFPAYSLVAIPKHLSYEEASTLPCAAVTAYNALFGSVAVKPGDYVLVQGTGGVSIFGLQMALAAGATVIATSSSDEKLKIASKLGAQHLINYRKTPNWGEEALKITGGVGVDHVLEVGGPGTFSESVKASRIGGHIHVVGFVAKGGSSDGSSESSVVMNTLLKALHVRGIRVGSVAHFNDMNRLFTARPDQTRPVIDKVFSFEDAPDAYKHLHSQAHVGKVVIKVSKE